MTAALGLLASTAACDRGELDCAGDDCDILAETGGPPGDDAAGETGGNPAPAGPCDDHGGIGAQVEQATWECINETDHWVERTLYTCVDGTPVDVVNKTTPSNPATDYTCPKPPPPESITCVSDEDCEVGSACAWAPGDAPAFTCQACPEGHCPEPDPSALAFGWAEHSFESHGDCQDAVAEGLPGEVLAAAHASLLEAASFVCPGGVHSVHALDDGGAYWPTCGNAEGGAGPTLSLDVVGYALCS